MTSSNIDPVTGRDISDDERDTVGVGVPDYTGADGPSYASETTGNFTDDLGGLGERDHTAAGTRYDASTDEVPGTGFEPLGGSVSSGDLGSVDPDSSGSFSDGRSAELDTGSDDSTSGGVKDKAKQVAGQVGDQAGAVKDTVGEQAAATKDAVTEKAGQVKDVAVQRAGDVAGVTKDELGKLASDARGQLQTLWGQAAGQLREQAGAGQHQLADLVHDLAGELGEVASKADSDGPVTSLLKQAAYRGGEFSHWLSEAETGDVLTELRRFARRRPVAFLAGATLAGILVGRLSRGLMAAAKTEQQSPSGTDLYDADVATDGSGNFGRASTDANAATPGVLATPPVSYAEVPDFSADPAFEVDTGFPGELAGEPPVPPGYSGGDRR